MNQGGANHPARIHRLRTSASKAKDLDMILISEDEYCQHREEYDGFCLACSDWTTSGVEPDARGYQCEVCGKHRVFGAEEVMIMGVIEIED